MPKTGSKGARICGLAGIAALAALLTPGAAPAAALEPPPDWLKQARGVNPDDAPSTRVPNCIRRPPRPFPGANASNREIIRWLRREFRCAARVGTSIASLFVQFLVAVDDGDGQRACTLLTRDERARLGDSLCPSQFEAIAGRTRVEREPFPQGFAFERRWLRGELAFRLVRPLESILLRFEADGGRWRMSNTRDLFRQRLPVPPPPQPAPQP